MALERRIPEEGGGGFVVLGLVEVFQEVGSSGMWLLAASALAWLLQEEDFQSFWETFASMLRCSEVFVSSSH